MSFRLGTPDYNPMAVKPDNNDGIGIFDTSVNEHKTIYYSTLKSFFVKTDEATTITADHKIATGNQLLFGSGNESFITYNGTNFYVGNYAVSPTAKLILRVNATDFLTLDPVNDSLKISTNVLNNTGAASAGLQFSASNELKALSKLLLYAGLSTLTQNVSYTGAASTGLEFNVSNHATFNQNLTIIGLLIPTGHIQMAAKNISYTGAVNTGLEFTVGNNGYFNGGCEINGLLTASAGVAMSTNCISGSGAAGTGLAFLGGPARSHFYEFIECDDYIQATNSLIGGSTSYCQVGFLKIKDGSTAPGTLPGWAWIYVDTADGDLKIKFGDGTTKTIVTDT